MIIVCFTVVIAILLFLFIGPINSRKPSFKDQLIANLAITMVGTFLAVLLAFYVNDYQHDLQTKKRLQNIILCSQLSIQNTMANSLYWAEFNNSSSSSIEKSIKFQHANYVSQIFSSDYFNYLSMKAKEDLFYSNIYLEGDIEDWNLVNGLSSTQANKKILKVIKLDLLYQQGILVAELSYLQNGVENTELQKIYEGMQKTYVTYRNKLLSGEDLVIPNDLYVQVSHNIGN